MQPTQPRQRDVLTSNILFVGFAVSWLVWWVQLHGHSLPVGVKPVKDWVPIVTGLPILGWYYAIRLGKPWAKYLLLVLFIGGLVLNLTYHPERLLQTWRASWLTAVSYAVGMVTQLWALALLFHKPRQIIPL